MKHKEYSQFTDQELLKEEKALKSFSIINALLIGVLLGIILFSIYYRAYGILLLIPLFLIYKFLNDPKNKRVKELEKVLKERNLNKIN